MTIKTPALVLMSALLLTTLGACSAWGQVVVRQAGSGGAYRSPYSGSLYYLRMPQVEKDLELADYQREKIKKLQEEIGPKMRQAYSELQDFPPEERTKIYYEQLKKFSKETEEKVQEILLPHQRDRLKQLELQLTMRYRGAQAFDQSELAKTLGITEEQQKQIREKQTEMYKKLQQEYQRIRNEAQQELLESVLSAEQLKKLKELMGTEIASP